MTTRKLVVTIVTFFLVSLTFFSSVSAIGWTDYIDKWSPLEIGDRPSEYDGLQLISWQFEFWQHSDQYWSSTPLNFVREDGVKSSQDQFHNSGQIKIDWFENNIYLQNPQVFNYKDLGVTNRQELEEKYDVTYVLGGKGIQAYKEMPEIKISGDSIQARFKPNLFIDKTNWVNDPLDNNTTFPMPRANAEYGRNVYAIYSLNGLQSYGSAGELSDGSNIPYEIINSDGTLKAGYMIVTSSGNMPSENIRIGANANIFYLGGAIGYQYQARIFAYFTKKEKPSENFKFVSMITTPHKMTIGPKSDPQKDIRGIGYTTQWGLALTEKDENIYRRYHPGPMFWELYLETNENASNLPGTILSFTDNYEIMKKWYVEFRRANSDKGVRMLVSYNPLTYRLYTVDGVFIEQKTVSTGLHIRDDWNFDGSLIMIPVVPSMEEGYYGDVETFIQKFVFSGESFNIVEEYGFWDDMPRALEATKEILLEKRIKQ